MMDKATAHFFNVLDEHTMEAVSFYRSPAAVAWYGKLKRATNDLPSANWKTWADDVIAKLQSAEDVRALDNIFLNVYENQMSLIWA